MTRFLKPALLLVTLACAGARAEVSQTSATGFTVTERREVNAAPQALVAAVGKVAAWWGDEHTYSQHASNLSLDARAGGCFCERWAEGSVEHARVIYAEPGIVRLSGALGPLQGLAVNGVLTFTIQAPAAASKDAPSKNLLVVTYRIGGGEAADMQRMPPLVDGMMSETTDKLARYLASGLH